MTKAEGCRKNKAVLSDNTTRSSSGAAQSAAVGIQIGAQLGGDYI